MTKEKEIRKRFHSYGVRTFRCSCNEEVLMVGLVPSTLKLPVCVLTAQCREYPRFCLYGERDSNWVLTQKKRKNERERK